MLVAHADSKHKFQVSIFSVIQLIKSRKTKTQNNNILIRLPTSEDTLILLWRKQTYANSKINSVKTHCPEGVGIVA